MATNRFVALGIAFLVTPLRWPRLDHRCYFCGAPRDEAGGPRWAETHVGIYKSHDLLAYLSGRAKCPVKGWWLNAEGVIEMKVLAIDVGGTHVKILATGEDEVRKFASGPAMTPKQMVAGVRKLAEGWRFDAVSIGYPGPVLHGHPIAEPHHLGPGWVGFDFRRAIGCPVRLMNDAAMQALGSYSGGRMLFLGLGTGLGSAMVVNGIVEPMELGHLPYKKGVYEDYVGALGLAKHGKGKWRRHVADVVRLLIAALEPDDVVLGGGNAKELKELPQGCRLGDNTNAFLGGFRLWTQHPSQGLSGPRKGRRNRIERGEELRSRLLELAKKA